MGDLAIRAERLGKCYRLGTTVGHSTLKETLATLLPFTRGRAPHADASGRDASDGDAESFWALRDVSFEVERGEVLGIVGRNGAGKSTLLKLLSRIALPSEGRAEITGRVGSLLEVGTGFHPELTGRENVFLNGAIIGMGRAELRAKFDEIVAFAGVERFIDTPVKRYSSGMYTRLAFAIAAHLEPEILIVDEVLAVGDASFQRKCLDKMRAAAGEGRTVLFVSHNMATIHALTHRCLLLDAGRLALDDVPARAAAAYLATVGSAEPRRDLAESWRPSWIGLRRAFEFTKIAVGTPPNRLGSDPLRVSVGYRCLDDVCDVAVRVAVCHPNGIFLAAAYSADDGALFSFRAGSSGVLDVEIECPGLQPGLYHLAIGAGSADHPELDFVPEALHFEVPAPPAESAARIAATGALGVKLRGRWEERSETDAEDPTAP